MSLYTVPQKLKSYSSRLHSAAWDRSRHSKWWKGQVPVRWTVISVVKVSASQAHCTRFINWRILSTFPDFPSPLVLGYLSHLLLGPASCLGGHVPKFKCIFLTLGQNLNNMLWISLWTCVNIWKRKTFVWNFLSLCKMCSKQVHKVYPLRSHKVLPAFSQSCPQEGCLLSAPAGQSASWFQTRHKTPPSLSHLLGNYGERDEISQLSHITPLMPHSQYWTTEKSTRLIQLPFVRILNVLWMYWSLCSTLQPL